MHEAAIAKSILRKVGQRLEELHQPGSVASVTVQVGQFRNVDPDSLSFAFDSLKSDYAKLAGARLQVELITAIATCQTGEHRYAVCPESDYRCTQCGSGIGKLLSGEELAISNMAISPA